MTPSPSPARRRAAGPLAALAALVALLAAAPAPARAAGPQVVRVATGPEGSRLTVDGEDFMVLGMNWDYFPVGTNYNYGLWTQPDEVIEAALANEMPLLKRMGVNALRLYSGVPARWIRYIYERWGIWTVLNHTVGRYGYTLDGTWVATVDYSDPRFRAAVKAELAGLVEEFKGTPGLLMWLLGNESNYGLSWSSFEIEALPQGEREVAKARYLYSLFGEIIDDIKARDPNHPVSIANGDVQYIDLIASECKGLDVLGVNAYRGRTMTDLYDVVKARLGKPVLFTEFGADAFDARQGREDDLTQARYLLAQWEEIYQQSAGKGRTGSAIGGLVFQWSDGWWKYRQEVNLDVHDTHASWPNGGYKEDFVEGENNMNEEWWGICAKGRPDARGLYPLYPRTAYYALQQAFRLDPYAPTTTPAAIAAHFGAVVPEALAFHYRADQAAAGVADLARVRLSGLRFSLETYSTGGNSRWERLVPREDPACVGCPSTDPLPAVRGGSGFDHTESLYLEAEARPTDRVTATATVNVLGNVAANPIDEIFYERRALPTPVWTYDTSNFNTGVTLEGYKRLRVTDRTRIYRAALSWDSDHFQLDGFFRSGHYHWASEGDLFGLYREANYGANVDTYDADAPAGFEVTGKRQLDGLKLAFGPQLWWGANPAVMAKYRHRVGSFDVTVLHQEDVAQGGGAAGASSALPEVKGRKTTLALEGRIRGVGVELAGIWSGSAKVDRPFVDEDGRPDRVRAADTLGARAKVTLERGPVHWYAQAAYMGLVADAGPDPRITFTGWTLKDSGSGNQVNALTGVAMNLGMFQIGPNLLWQKPLVGPGQSIRGGGFSRNVDGCVQDPARPAGETPCDPFSVRGNRETVAAELMLVFDPTPATWMWQWDNDLQENAPFAASLDVVWRHQPTVTDAATAFYPDGVNRFAFPTGSPARDVLEVNARVVSMPLPGLRLVLHAFGGTQQANGPDPRQPRRYGGDFRLSFGSLAVQGHAKFNDWGPYDYHRDFNLTFPLQLMGDVSWNLGPARWLWLQQTRVGVRATSRWLNGYSPRYVLDRNDPRAWGHEYELRTYLVVTL